MERVGAKLAGWGTIREEHYALLDEGYAVLEKIQADTDRDNFLGAEQSKEYGLIDDILVSRNKLAEQAAKD